MPHSDNYFPASICIINVFLTEEQTLNTKLKLALLGDLQEVWRQKHVSLRIKKKKRIHHNIILQNKDEVNLKPEKINIKILIDLSRFQIRPCMFNEMV